MKNLLLIFSIFSFSTLLKAQTVNVTVSNVGIVSNALQFDIYLSATSGTLYLGDADIRFTFNTANFTSATFTEVTGYSDLTIFYAPNPTIVNGNVLTINIPGVTPSSGTFSSRVSAISSTPVRLGRYQLTTISNPNGTAGLSCGTMAINTYANTSPFNETVIPQGSITCSPSNVPLPVELLSLQAQNQGKTNLLTWQTATEKDNDGFQVQRSADANLFETMGYVKGHGTTTVTQNYNFTDSTPLNITYYRLRQVDVNGNESFSNTVSVVSESKMSVQVFPNPAEGILNIQFNDEKEQNTEIVMFDNLGRTVYHYTFTSRIGQNHLFFGTQQFAAGIYSLKINQGIATTVEQIVIR